MHRIASHSLPAGRAARRAGVVLGLSGAVLVGTALAATAAPDQTNGREITRYDVTATLDASGVADVSVDFDFDFGDDPGHGPYLTLPTRQGYDETLDRAFEYSGITVSSPSGAPADLHREESDGWLTLRIGDEDVDDVSGVQSYRLTYRVDGLVNPANEQHSGDELYWNVIGEGWEIPIGDVSATVTGPADVEGAVCFAGPSGSTAPCTSASTLGATATFTQDLLGRGEPFTTVTGWPGGTFVGAEPILVERPDPAAVWAPASPLGGVAVLAALGGSALAVRRVRRTGRDRAYLGLTPGLRPVHGQDVGSGYRDKRTPVSVQFTPPENVRPGELGTLVDEKADPVDVTATLIDLAVRGYLRIEEVPRKNPKKKPKDWTLVRLRPADGALLEYEVRLLDDVFDDRSSVTLSDLKQTFATSMGKVQDALYDQVTSLGWFRANPKSVRGAWIAAGIALIVAAGIALAVAIAVGGSSSSAPGGLALVPVAIGLVGVVVLVCAKHAPARTEDGTAVLAQALGFRTYLTTAEADQIRFEEGQDVFSRYLPYAIVFGVAERWARVFAELAAQGRAIAAPGWYVGYYDPLPGVFWASGFASSIDRFQTVATESLTAPTPGSSGDSGFSGGGFSGGGVGGGGGGGW
ncbi:DUF2207 domain-containing protein [Cellulomonas palmilytica]|uniref:DUF2207 domain-containing protein n=1 Tax=Cellulomonas palmilytica TaxID=2608402 RepID=UPI001F30D6BC|nr:DUF2207 domain-containing protein [Cellulomonas palmilytica]UJP41453.1 DUF2207 domain-containing protein [Cellulomonas palmilytica]